MNAPLISVITIALNEGESIRRTLESIACQTFTDYEHLIIDGGSTDNTLAIIQEFHLPKTKVTSEKDTGITNAMNKGIRQSSGEIIVHLNAGDEFYAPDGLSKIAESYQRLNWDWAIGSWQYIEESGKLASTTMVNGFDYETLRRICFVGHQSTFITKRVFERFGLFDESFMLFAMDYEFWLRIGRHVEPCILPFIIAKSWQGGVSSKYVLRVYAESRRARAKNDPRNRLSTFPFETTQLVYACVAWLLRRYPLLGRWRSKFRKVKGSLSGNTSHAFTIVDAK